MKNKVVVKKVSWTLRLLYYWGKFIGIVSLTLSENNELEFSYFSLLYGCLLAAIYVLVIYKVLFIRLNGLSPIATPIAVIVGYIEIISVFLEISSTWLVTAFHQNRMKFIVNSFVKVEKTSRKLGIVENYEKRFAQLGIQLAFVNVFYIILVTFSNLTLRYSQNFHGVIWTCYSIPKVSSLNVGTLFLWCLLIVKQKFRLLNEKLRSLMQNDSASYSEVNEELCLGLIKTGFLSDRITSICQLHRELRDVIRRIETHFALLVFFNWITQFFSLTLNSYGIYRFVKLYSPIRGMTFVYLCAIGFWVALPVAIIATVAKICTSTMHEANKTRNILHAMLNDNEYFYNSREAAKLNVLSLDLLHNQTRLTLLGFFDLDSFLVFKSIAIAAMYLVIMLQFYS